MGKLTAKSTAEESYPAGAHLSGAKTFETGTVGGDVAFLLTGTGTGSFEAPFQHYTKYTSQTGAVTLDLTALPRPGGASYNFGHIREITIQNLSVTDGQFLSVGNATPTPFVGPFNAGTDIVKVEPGATVTIACKPYGAGYVTSGAINLKLDFGAATFDAAVVIKGY